MGSEKTTTVVDNTQKATPTPEETEWIKLMLEQYKQIQPQQTAYQSNAFNLANALLQGQQLPGYLGTLPGGISSQDAATQATQYALNAMPGMQSLGLGESGVAARSIAKGIANEVTLPVAEYNSNLLLNLLNLATGQASQGTSSFQSGSNTLANQLAGLRTIQSSETTTQKGMNPFLKSFQQNFGQTLGAPKVQAGPFSFGG